MRWGSCGASAYDLGPIRRGGNVTWVGGYVCSIIINYFGDTGVKL